MNGILLIDKPKNLTSRDVVNKVGKILGTKKIGHTGTLDPIATGVMVMCIGKYTKLVEILTSYDKTYESEIVLGTLTDTLDITGKVLREENTVISKENIVKTLKKFECSYDQEVPIYSAVKINGKKLYEYARNGEIIELPKRRVEIYSLELISDVEYKDNKTIFKIRCSVSKGTYIRSLINDIAHDLNTIGTMKNLRRIKQGDFDIKNCHTIEDIENNKYEFLNLNEVLKDIYIVEVDSTMESKIKNGALLDNIYNENLICFRKNDKIIAIYKPYSKDISKIKPYKMF